MSTLYVPPAGAPTALIVDLDGTLALRGTQAGARQWYDWSRVGEDEVNWPVYHLITALSEAYAEALIFVSGRKDICRSETEEWLTEHVGLRYEHLHMRRADDNRQDAIIKREIFDEHIRGNYNVLYVIDDRDQCVRAWRELGLTVLQIADGAF